MVRPAAIGPFNNTASTLRSALYPLSARAAALRSFNDPHCADPRESHSGSEVIRVAVPGLAAAQLVRGRTAQTGSMSNEASNCAQLAAPLMRV